MKDSLNKHILCYASGGSDLGYGHLFRLTRLIELLNLKDRAVFLYQNQEEKDFLVSKKFRIINNNLKPSDSFNLIVIDSKFDASEIHGVLRNKKIPMIVLDSLEGWTAAAEKIVIPSFFLNKDRLKGINPNIGNKVIWGKEYSLLSEPRYRTKNLSDKILVTFGGSDPNNLTFKALKALKNTPFVKRCRVILGPGYNHHVEKILQISEEIEIVRNSNNMQEEICNSSIIMTALGVTLQDVEYYQKKTIVVCNYPTDLSDFYWIKEYSSNTKNLRCIGLADDISKEILVNTIEELDFSKEPELVSNGKWGKGWKGLFKDYLI